MGDAAAAPAAERDALFRKLRAKPENKVCAEGECVCVCVRGCVRPLVGSERGRVAVPPPPRDWRASLCVACVVCAPPPLLPPIAARVLASDARPARCGVGHGEKGERQYCFCSPNRARFSAGGPRLCPVHRRRRLPPHTPPRTPN